MRLSLQPAPHKGWRDLLIGFGLLVPAGAAGLSGTGDPGAGATAVILAAALFATASWLMVVRFVFLDSGGRRFWLVVHLLSVLALATLGTGGVVLACVASVSFLLFRRYLCWRCISDRRRAIGFGLGLPALILSAVVLQAMQLPSTAGGLTLAKHFGVWSGVSLIMFWAASMFHLALRMRLHFLRLRPKLAVSAVLIGAAPLALMVLLGLAVLYTGLGGARAARTDAILENWRVMADAGTDLAPALFDTTFSWPEPGAPAPHRIAAPEWVPTMAKRLPPLIGRDVSDTTGWYLAGHDLWLMRWRGLGGDSPAVTAWQLGGRPLTTLSNMLRCGLDLSSVGDLVLDTAATPADSASARRLFPGRKVSYRDVADSGAFWTRWSYFGATLFQVDALRGDRMQEMPLFIQLRVGPADLQAEFLEGDANLNIAVVAALGFVALLFLVLVVFALFFGVRISEGIVSGVHSLHRGTRAVAAGDLDTVIAIPNQDEFGDLAASFNEMTTAVRHGREIALANERLVQELATARAIQLRLLPGGEPRVPGFEVTGASIPSREIGGDYYDFLAQDEDRIGIAIGDVSGKGMPAALLMSNLQASLQGQILHPGSVAGVVERVNELLVKSTDPHMFATFFYGLLDASTGRFTCTNAGHNPPLLLRADGTFEELTTGGLLLGMVGAQAYKQDTVDLAPGEIIVMYTDGITEAVGPSAEEDDPEAMFGEEALRAVVARSRQLPAAGIKDAILAAVADHTQGVPQSDDITLVVIRRQG